MTLNGFFVRSALTQGPVCLTDEIIFGSALIECYLLESKASIVPRIVLAEPLQQLVMDSYRAGRQFFGIQRRSGNLPRRRWLVVRQLSTGSRDSTGKSNGSSLIDIKRAFSNRCLIPRVTTCSPNLAGPAAITTYSVIGTATILAIPTDIESTAWTNNRRFIGCVTQLRARPKVVHRKLYAVGAFS